MVNRLVLIQQLHQAYDEIRNLFAMTPEARMKGYKPGRFSFNVSGGRCENCQGRGTMEIEMHFLPNVEVVCDFCKGKRFNKETLAVHYKGKNIAEVLEMTIEEAEKFFRDIPLINDKLKVLSDVGLGYLTLGQSATTLSGGESQRIKLSRELSKKSRGKTLYLLDEPTTGLHYEDIKKLILVLQKLVNMGNTVMVIEHNLDFIKCADWIIDLGEDGGDKGGKIVGEGTPEEIARLSSWTGFYLRKIINEKWREKIDKIPQSSGVYLFYQKGNLVYVGKATSLRSRIKSYLSPKTNRPIETLIDKIDEVKWEKTNSFLEAIILEANYIKNLSQNIISKKKMIKVGII